MVGLCIPVGVVRAGDWSLDLGDSEFPLTPNEELEKQKPEEEKKTKRGQNAAILSGQVWRK